MEGKGKDPLWFKQAVIYQLHVKSFYDLNDDGIGDFPGLEAKLTYLESLGITAIWLLPFYSSPLKDDGYDISDYYTIHSSYGKLNDFRRFLNEAHKRGMRIITELVINHTSDQHPWFQRARRAAPGSAWRNFYVWSDTPSKYEDARIIFQDFESSNWSWDPLAKAYYWHRFYSHQPDLNFENPLVQKEVLRALDFWFKMGVDGLRLDAVPYLFESVGTNCENLPKTHAFIKKLRLHVEDKFQDRVLIAEANQWPEEAVAYFGSGDECHMAFHFPVMPRLFMAIQMEDRFPIIDILEQTPVLPPTCQWIMFLRNHDELTLEMVSDEERDYMYRIYAKDPKARINLGIRRRLAPLLDNDRFKIQLMNILLFSLPGTPVIYYGDEIGMGDNYYLGDRNGVRTPMQWSSDRNAGFSKANPQRLFLPLIIDPAYHYEVVNVENQERNPSSLLWWIRRVLLVRQNHKAFGFGSLEFITSDNSKVLAFIRSYQDEIILIVTNLSRFAQAAELDMSKYVGYLPVEVFHQSKFPKIKDKGYHVTLSPYAFFWLSLTPSQTVAHLANEQQIPKLSMSKSWDHILKPPYKSKLEQKILPSFFRNARWFDRKTATIQRIDVILDADLGDGKLCFAEVKYIEVGDVDTYLIILAFASKSEAESILMDRPHSVIANLQVGDQEGILYDGIYSEQVRAALFGIIVNKRTIKLDSQFLHGYPGGVLNKKVYRGKKAVSSQIVAGEQTNTSFVFGNQFFLKLYRKLEEGINSDIEMEKFLSEKTTFTHIPLFRGAIEWQRLDKQPTAIAMLQTFVPHETSGWTFTLDALRNYFERVLAGKDLELKAVADSPSQSEELIGGNYLEAARLLGQCTAEMHLALSSRTDDPAFRPESFSTLYQRSIYQAMRSHVSKALQFLRRSLPSIPEKSLSLAEAVLNSEPELIRSFQGLTRVRLPIVRTRIHGDYHLGQILYQGKGFCITDFEGEPLQALGARRIKRSPLRDVAGMLRSFHYAAYKTLLREELIRPELILKFEPWADFWYQQVSAVFLKAYMELVKTASVPILSTDSKENIYLLKIFMLDKAVYELLYELNTRPDWVDLPCKGILAHLSEEKML